MQICIIIILAVKKDEAKNIIAHLDKNEDPLLESFEIHISSIFNSIYFHIAGACQGYFKLLTSVSIIYIYLNNIHN